MSNLSLATNQYNELRRRIREHDPAIDDETLSDTVEGLTDLHDILRVVMRSALTDEAQAMGLRWRIEQMQARLKRIEERAGNRRQIVRDAMVEAEIKKITAPDFTVSLRAGTPSLVVADEGLIPSQFWEPRSPRLNRQALLSELKRGDQIPGVQLSNPEMMISVRTK